MEASGSAEERLKSCDYWSLQRNDWNNIWAAASWPGHFKRAPVVPPTLILQSCRKETGCVQELMCFGSHVLSLVSVKGLTQLGTLRDTLEQSLSVYSAIS
ncbi:hypothetical protein P7K49_008268, partial [Saguinus oedipus]